MCIELPLGYQAGRRHPRDGGCMTGQEIRRQGAPRVEVCWQWVLASQFVSGRLTQATVSLSSAESEAKTMTKGCIEALYVKHLLETSGFETIQN